MGKTVDAGPRTISTPPVAVRLATGHSALGGLAIAQETVRAAGVSIRDRLVHLAPGLSDTIESFVDAAPRDYIAVEQDPAVAALLAGRGIDVVDAPIGATGLPDACASVVVAEGILCGLDETGVAAALAEAERLLCPRGRLVVREVAGHGVAAPSGAPARATSWWTTAIGDAGLAPIGTFSGPLGQVEDPWPSVLRAGPRAGARLGPALARELSPLGAGEKLRRLRTASTADLEAVVILAEKPVIRGMRWSDSL